MRKTALLTLLIILAMALSACAGGGGEDISGTEGAGGFGEETTMPGGGSGVSPTEDTGLGIEPTTTAGASGGVGTSVPETGGQLSTPTLSSGGTGGTTSTRVPTTAGGTGGLSVTQTPTISSGGTGGTTGTRVPTVSGGPGDVAPSAAPTSGGQVATAIPTWPAVSGTSVPATGGQVGDFALLSQLIGYELNDTNGDSLGSISDFVISVPDEMVDYVVVEQAAGSAVLVPWAEIMLDAQSTQAFSFNGAPDELTSAPMFEAASVDFSDPNWDQDVLDYWTAPGGTTGGGTVSTPSAGGGVSSTPVSGTSVPSTGGTSTPVPTVSTGTGGMTTGTPTAAGTGGMTTGTPSAVATGTIPGTGVNEDPSAVLFTELLTYDVVSQGQQQVSTSVPATGGTAMPTTTGGTGMSTGTSVPPTGSGTVTGTATSIPSTGTGSVTGTAVPATGTGNDVTGDVIGTVEDAVVNVLSGQVTFVLVSLDEMDGTGGIPSTGAGTATSIPTTGAGAGTTTSVPTTGTTVPGTGSAVGTTVPQTGTGVGTATSVPGSGMSTSVPTTTGTGVPTTGRTGQVVPIPMEFLRITADNQVVVLVANDRLQQAPVLDLGTLQDPINMGWDAEYNTFWMGGGAGVGTGGGTVTSTPQP